MTDFDPAKLSYDAQGLVPVVAQESTTGEVLMLAWANREALETSLVTKRMHYWSRSRQTLWEKGEESGHRQSVVRLAGDCDSDAVLALVHQSGPACHENTATCFGPKEGGVALPIVAELAAVLADRKEKMPAGSYTAKLLGDPSLAIKKIGEEAAELVLALSKESDERVAEEAADVLFHVLAACQGRGVPAKQVLDVLERRHK